MAAALVNAGPIATNILAPKSESDSVTVDTLGDWDALTAMVADQIPVAPPDTMNAYSAYGFGWTLGEVVRRTDPQHRGFHQFVRDEVLAPLGMDDFFLGLPDEQVPRVAALLGQTATVFPSHHGGFLGGEHGYAGQPEAFARKLRSVLVRE